MPTAQALGQAGLILDDLEAAFESQMVLSPLIWLGPRTMTRICSGRMGASPQSIFAASSRGRSPLLGGGYN